MRERNRNGESEQKLTGKNTEGTVVKQTERMERSERAAERGSVDKETERQGRSRSFQRERKQTASAERWDRVTDRLEKVRRQQMNTQTSNGVVIDRRQTPCYGYLHWFTASVVEAQLSIIHSVYTPWDVWRKYFGLGRLGSLLIFAYAVVLNGIWVMWNVVKVSDKVRAREMTPCSSSLATAGDLGHCSDFPSHFTSSPSNVRRWTEVQNPSTATQTGVAARCRTDNSPVTYLAAQYGFDSYTSYEVGPDDVQHLENQQQDVENPPGWERSNYVPALKHSGIQHPERQGGKFTCLVL